MALRIPKKINVITGLLALFTFSNVLMLVVTTLVFFTQTEPHITLTPIFTALVFTVFFGSATVWSYKDDKKRATDNP